jgi:hypothetical protein
MGGHTGDCSAGACRCAPAPPSDATTLVDPVGWSTRRRRALRRGAQARSVVATAPLTTLLLDIGGVVIPTLFESVVAPELPPGPFGGDAAYARVERGGGQERDYWLQLIDQRPDVDIGALWRACSYVRCEVRDVVARLAGRVRVVAFTNDMAHWFGDDWRQRFAELAAFDDVLEAAALGVLKPAPEAFSRAARAIGEDPAHCLFVDDLPANLDGAAAVGMATLHFDVRDPQRSIDALFARLGLAATEEPARRVFVPPRPGSR